MDDGELDNGWLPTLNEIYPKIWDSEVPLDAHLDYCMHLLFHGVVVYIIEVLDKLLACHGLTNRLKREVNIHLLEMCMMRLTWCKSKNLPKNSGWQKMRLYVPASFFSSTLTFSRMSRILKDTTLAPWLYSAFTRFVTACTSCWHLSCHPRQMHSRRTSEITSQSFCCIAISIPGKGVGQRLSLSGLGLGKISDTNLSAWTVEGILVR